MSRKGYTLDNQCIRRLSSELLETEVFRKHKWGGVTLKELKERINRYIVWYNTTMRKRSLKGVSLMEFRQSLDLALAA